MFLKACLDLILFPLSTLLSSSPSVLLFVCRRCLVFGPLANVPLSQVFVQS